MLIILSIGFIAPSKLYAVEIAVGPSAWYLWLDQPYTKNVYDDNYVSKYEPEIFYGPAISVKFNDDFNLSFIYLYGKFPVTEIDDPGNGFANKIKYKFIRKDSDLALSYRLDDRLRVFAGIKYMSIKDEFNYPLQSGFGTGLLFDLEHSGIGPGFGFNFTYPVYKDLLLTANLSRFYLWGKETKGFMRFHPSGGSNPPVPTSAKADFNDTGFNFSLSFAYYIAPLSTAISFGGRVQYVKTEYKDYDSDFLYKGDTCKFYGFTATAIYSFSIL